MHHVGIDLAWGTRRPTGVAVLDDQGRLVELASVRTDDEIGALVAPYVAGPCTVGVDAPLVVTNPTGFRPAERALDADFRRFDAGTHPTNTGKPEFRDGSRGGRLAEAWGLDLDPGLERPAADRRRVVEVYPHAATVALFGLGRTLKYKQKPGRDLSLLRGELLALMGLLEGLRTATPPLLLDERWRALRTAATDATRKSELRHVEDQVDAVVCAYVALLVTRDPGRLTVYGEPATGLIVTPTLPAGHVPSPRPARLDGHPPAAPDVHAAVTAYAAGHPALVVAGTRFLDLVRGVLDDSGITYLSVTGRTKTVASYAEKARRLGSDGRPLFDDPAAQITDVIGLRVITYVQRDVDAVVQLLEQQVDVVSDRDLGRETARTGRFGYASRHLLITSSAPGLGGLLAQVQLRTVLQHAWAEFEHDIRYKGTVPPEHAHDFDRRFTLAAGLLELADQEFTTIRDTLRAGAPTAQPDDRIGPRELAAFLAGQYDDAGWSRPDDYDWMAELVDQLGIEALSGLTELLRSVDEAGIAARMGYRYPPGAVRRLDDALLLARGEDYVALPGNAHRVDLLATRLTRLRATP